MASGEGDKMSEKRVATVFDLARMCKSFDSTCFGCPINKDGRLCPTDIGEEEIEAILKWCDAHPQKTYAQDFFEKFPNAERCIGYGGKEYPKGVCRVKIFGIEKEDIGCIDKSCSYCWNEAMHDDEK